MHRHDGEGGTSVERQRSPSRSGYCDHASAAAGGAGAAAGAAAGACAGAAAGAAAGGGAATGLPVIAPISYSFLHSPLQEEAQHNHNGDGPAAGAGLEWHEGVGTDEDGIGHSSDPSIARDHSCDAFSSSSSGGVSGRYSDISIDVDASTSSGTRFRSRSRSRSRSHSKLRRRRRTAARTSRKTAAEGAAMRQQLQEKQAEVLLLQQQVRRIISQDMPTELDRCACLRGRQVVRASAAV